MSSLRDRLDRLRAHSASSKATDASPGDAAAEESAEQSTGTSVRFAERMGDAVTDSSGPSAGRERGATVTGVNGALGSGLHPSLAALDVEEVAGEYGSFLRRRAVYPLEHRHGHYVLTELISCAGRLKPIAARQNRKRGTPAADSSIEPEDIEAKRLLFLDTETTGLGVGTGNLPFMIGFGYADGEAGTFTVEQLLIRHPGEERAMLAYLLGKFAGVTHLVTYNGRSFDWPVLTSRFVLNGWRPSGVEPGHLDFLHSARALWKNTLPSCKLSRIEEDRLGIVRGEDVPGSLAPELYMKYLSDGDASHLRGVYIHNERDILTLASLTVHFGGVLEGRLGAEWALPAEPEELFRTAAWLADHGGELHAERLFAALVAEGMPGGRWLLPAAARLKRLGRHGEAAELWERAASLAESRLLPSAEAHIELSMHYEHRCREPGIALDYASRALELLQRRTSLRQSDRVRAELDAIRHRMARLSRKIEAIGRLG
ncbi:ribonuclease H-like domain-containing protein [Cohnella hashimotonis]|uniref:Ribonuclease H-like domain-containing protein n=1 Tax=Cohnella hashimotonis TaxID=2826895 RepID=A0ABT6TGD1_9BACL|nr:ribonuclease H-like domain-containing protein [Cohnella hashimotonis]MDI4645631.1 ribonuclease H-like domain-containing protein [Cohnella hashimotonis]